MLVNCSPPEAVGRAIAEILELGIVTGGYANGFETIEPLTRGETVDALSRRNDLDPERYADHALSWVEQGAAIIGGCCEVSPAHIAEIARRLAA